MLKRIAMLSAHTSPLEQPGTGDAGGMNVYVLELSRQLAARSIEVEIFTRATSRHQPPVVEAEPGIVVRHVAAGPFEGLQKNDLPSQLCGFVRDVLRVEVERDPGHFDLVHSHYWLSGQIGTVTRERWGVPLVHTMHTMAKVKNAQLAAGDIAEPMGRIAGEEEIVRLADRLIANTDAERQELVELYGAEPRRVEVVHPGVDLDVFRSGRQLEARRALGVPDDASLVLFAGRIQPLKAPDVVIEAAARLIELDPSFRGRLRVAVVGGPSGTGLDHPTALTDLSTGSASTTWSRSCPRSTSASSPTGTQRHRWSASRRTTSRSGWSRSRRRPAAPRWSPRPWAGWRLPCRTASRACSSTDTTRPTTRPPCTRCSSTPSSARP